MKTSIRRLLGCTGAVGLGWLIVVVATAGTASVSTIAASSSFRARALVAFKAEMASKVGPMLRSHRYPQRLVAGVTDVGSYNWGGYADTGSTPQEFTKVAGGWTVPTVTCTSEDRVVSDWVGLDGFSTPTVEQEGVSAQCFEGQALYYSWYEMYPAGTVEVGTTVKPGDKIGASVTRTGTSYTLVVNDSTTSGNNVNVTSTCALTTCLDESAEWINERPAYSTTGIVPLAQHSPVTFGGGLETAGGTTGTIASGPGPNAITLVDSTDSYDIASVSKLSATGKAFIATWKDSY